MGEGEAAPLVDLLNSKRRAKKRVEELLHMIASISRPSSQEPLKRIQDERAKEGPLTKIERDGKTVTGHLALLGATGTVEMPIGNGRKVKVVQTDPALMVKQNTTLMRIGKELARYKSYPKLEFQVDDQWVINRVWSNTPGVDAVHALLTVAEMGFLDRVRQCRKCGKWFFARFRHSVACSTECQQASVLVSLESKARKAKRMREKYWGRRQS